MGRGLHIVAPAEAVRGVAEALGRMEDAGVALDGTSPGPVLALLAAGRFESVRDLLRQAEPVQTLPLVLARYVAWTGDLRAATAVWPRVQEALQVLMHEGEDALRLASCSELERTATDLGHPQLAARLHGAARTLRQSRAGELRTDGNAGVVLSFVHELVGAEPDATRHRLRLRPRTDEALDVRQLRFGDGSVCLRVEPMDDAIRCVVEQEAGAIPVTVLLEPVLRGRVTGARVDGRTAELAPRPHEGGTLVPVQLVLDEARTLDVITV